MHLMATVLQLESAKAESATVTGKDDLLVAAVEQVSLSIPDSESAATQAEPEPEPEADELLSREEEEERPVNPTPPPSTAVASVPLHEFLILRIENGRDYFISVATKFCPTREGNTPTSITIGSACARHFVLSIITSYIILLHYFVVIKIF
jgi:hypothetical protein